MAQDIKHYGIVREIGDNYIGVSITPDKKECAGCAIASLCSKPELVQVPYLEPSAHLIGRKAEISLSYGLHWLSVSLFLAAPVFLLLATAMLSTYLNCTEAQVAAFSLGILIIWFLFLFLIRKKLPSKGIYKVISIS